MLAPAMMAALAVAVAGCGGSGATAAGGGSGSGGGSTPTKNLTLLLDWFPNPDHASLYDTQSKGYFKQAGLNVTLQAPSNASDPAKLVATGKVPLGISYEPEVMIAQANGLPVKAVGALVPTALNSIISPGSNHIHSIAQLKGKKIGTAGLASDTAFMKAVLGHAGLSLSNVSLVNVGSNLVSSMLSGSVNATEGGYRNVEAIQGFAPRALSWIASTFR